MTVLTQAQKRDQWSPACQKLHRPGLIEILQAENTVMRAYAYAPREGETWGGNCRKVTGGSTYSIHSYMDDVKFTFWSGVAINVSVAWDINSRTNPYGDKLVTDRPREMVDALLAIRTNSGEQALDWGGYFKAHKDAMHDEVRCSPADVASGIDWSTVYGFNQTPIKTQGVPDMAQAITYDDGSSPGVWASDGVIRVGFASEEELASAKAAGLVGETKGVKKSYIDRMMDAEELRYLITWGNNTVGAIKSVVDAIKADVEDPSTGGGAGSITTADVDRIARAVLDAEAARLKS